MNKYIRIIFASLFLAFLLCPTDVSAKHIIGGFFRYDHLGGGNYRFQLYVYRDCRPQENAATLDNPIPVGVFFENPNGNGYTLREELEIPLRRSSPVFAPELPCLTLPPNLCVEEGFYEFEYRIPNWPRNQSVVLSYQRCCRNNTISNIATPGDVGATFTVEITPFAMATGNSSPNFNEFPPTAICNQFPLEFDHSATDPNGDSLAYVFCSPLVGGGLQGGPDFPNGNAFGCDGIVPNPACPPPYGAVTFLTPEYSVGVPLGGNPVVSLDSETGLISGVPVELGQFVAAVCVEEWRNGQLLSVTRRDFQFNVTDCVATVNADMDATEKINSNTYYIRLCGTFDVEIDNLSTDRSKIEKFEWYLDGNGIDEFFETEDLIYTFPDYGRYNGILVANPELPCVDSAFIIIDVFEEINANFSFFYDTCDVNPVQFSNLSQSQGGEIIDVFWDFGDGNNSSVINPTHNYEASDNYNITLLVTDENGCQDFLTLPLEYYPIPVDLFLAPLDTIACQPLEFDFNVLNSFITDDYIINWDLGDGTTSDIARPFHIYDIPGIYSIMLSIENSFGCQVEYEFDNSVEVLVTPDAAFTYSPTEINRLITDISFNNGSINADTYFWDFGDGTTSTFFSPIHTFQDTGLLDVYLISINDNGCRDTAYAKIDNVPIITFFMPNAFSPNSDGTNDFYFGKGILDGYRLFDFKIFNRYGQMLFESEDPDIGWNGRIDNNGELQTPGVYVYKVELIDPRGAPSSYSGTFMLVR